MAKALAFSDTHMQFPKIRETAKLGLFNGDYESGRNEPEEAIRIGKEFIDFFSRLHFEYKLMVAGNHDTWYWNDKEAFIAYAKSKDVIVLDGELVKVGRYRIFGTPYLYTSRRNPEYKETLPEPDSFDILMTHVPPYGVRDFSVSKRENIGSLALRKFIQENRIGLHTFGHCHEGYGESGVFRNVALASRSKTKVLINKPQVIGLSHIQA